MHGVEPPYMFMRTIEVDRGRQLNWSDEENESQVGVIGWEMSKQLFGDRDPVGEQVLVNGTPFRIVGRIRRKDQDSNYSGPDNNKIFIPFAVMSKYFPRPDAPAGSLSQMLVMPRQEVVDGLEGVLNVAHRSRRGHRLAARAGDPRDPRAPKGVRSRRTATPSTSGTPRCRRCSSTA